MFIRNNLLHYRYFKRTDYGEAMKAKEYEEKTEKLVTAIAGNNCVSVYDVEFVKEGQDYYLRVYIDKPEGVNIDDCENVSRALSDELDRQDFIKEAYILEVSSPGLGRKLTKERHFLNSLGQEIELKTYKPIDNQKEFTGILSAYKDGNVEIDISGEKKSFNKSDIAMVRLTFDF